jgi:hypothetical protein
MTVAAGAFLYGLFLILRLPDLVSPKGLFVLALGIGVTTYACLFAALLWYANWKFVFTLDALRGVHVLSRIRVDVPWTYIVRMRRKRLYGGGRLGLFIIETLTELTAKAVDCRDIASDWRWEW